MTKVDTFATIKLTCLTTADELPWLRAGEWWATPDGKDQRYLHSPTTLEALLQSTGFTGVEVQVWHAIPLFVTHALRLGMHRVVTSVKAQVPACECSSMFRMCCAWTCAGVSAVWTCMSNIVHRQSLYQAALRVKAPNT